MSGRLYDEPLLEACLRDQRFDRQVEDSRGGWLWGMIQAICAADRFRVPVLHALYDLSDDRSASQLCELARFYAETGDETFRTQLYEIVEQTPFPDNLSLGEEEIIALDGESAFLFAVSVRGRNLASREWDWDDGYLIDRVSDRFGKEQVNGLLEASSDGAIRRFRERWQLENQRNAERTTPESYKERMKALPVEEIIRGADTERKCFSFRGWGLNAKEADLQTVLGNLWTARKPNVIANLLRVFSGRALPEFDPRLIELCRHDDEEVRRWAFRALEENEHPLIREFALTELQSGVRDGSAVALFIKNYHKGDEHRILESMEFSENECETHWLLMDAIKILEKNPEADCFPLGVLAYASTPCENCRFHAARLLHQKQVAPEWLTEESRYDSAKECRGLGGNPTGSPDRS